MVCSLYFGDFFLRRYDFLKFEKNQKKGLKIKLKLSECMDLG